MLAKVGEDDETRRRCMLGCITTTALSPRLQLVSPTEVVVAPVAAAQRLLDLPDVLLVAVLSALPATSLARTASLCHQCHARNEAAAHVRAEERLGLRLPPLLHGETYLHALRFVEKIVAQPAATLACGEYHTLRLRSAESGDMLLQGTVA